MLSSRSLAMFVRYCFHFISFSLAQLTSTSNPNTITHLHKTKHRTLHVYIHTRTCTCSGTRIESPSSQFLVLSPRTQDEHEQNLQKTQTLKEGVRQGREKQKNNYNYKRQLNLKKYNKITTQYTIHHTSYHHKTTNRLYTPVFAPTRIRIRIRIRRDLRSFRRLYRII